MHGWDELPALVALGPQWTWPLPDHRAPTPASYGQNQGPQNMKDDEHAHVLELRALKKWKFLDKILILH